MKKIIKTYLPIAISALFMVVYVSLIGITITLTIDENALAIEPNVWIWLVTTAILVFLILLEMILYMIHAIKNKDLENNGLWVAFIYLFNVFIIPYYHLKHVIKDENVKLKTKVYVGMMILACFIGAFLPKYLFIPNQDIEETVFENETYKTPDNKTEFTVSSAFLLTEVGEYDLYLKDTKRQINMGVFTYSLSEYQTTPEEILKEQVDFILETREQAEVISEETKNLIDGKTITTKTLTGTKNNSKCNYQLSVITTTNNEDYAVFIIQVTLEEDYENYKEELMKILYDTKIETEKNEEEVL